MKAFKDGNSNQSLNVKPISHLLYINFCSSEVDSHASNIKKRISNKTNATYFLVYGRSIAPNVHF